MKYFYCFLFLLITGSPFVTQAGSDKDAKLYAQHELSTTPDIEEETLHEVLTMAAPFYNYTGEQFIRLYYQCDCIEVTLVAPEHYRVEYGGIGIEILIDVSSVILTDDEMESQYGFLKNF